jgi:hypothetical protein
MLSVILSDMRTHQIGSSSLLLWCAQALEIFMIFDEKERSLSDLNSSCFHRILHPQNLHLSHLIFSDNNVKHIDLKISTSSLTRV